MNDTQPHITRAIMLSDCAEHRILIIVVVGVAMLNVVAPTECHRDKRCAEKKSRRDKRVEVVGANTYLFAPPPIMF
jgi:hypothetical protein